MSPTPLVPRPRRIPGDYLTLPEVADLFGVQRTTVNQWRFRRRRITNPDLAFPEPDDYAGDTPVWELHRLLKWADITDRPEWLNISEERWRHAKSTGKYRRPKQDTKKPPAAKAAAVKTPRKRAS